MTDDFRIFNGEYSRSLYATEVAGIGFLAQAF